MNASRKQPLDITADERIGRRGAKTPPPAGSRRQRLRLLLLVVVPLIAALVGAVVYVTGGRYVTTDDAYLQAARISISSDVAGRVVEVDVRDNQPVKAGQVLFKLDDRPYRIAVADAEAQLASAKLKIEAQKAVYRQRQADLQAARDTLDYQANEFERQKRLLAVGIASQAQYDQVAHALLAARQQLAATQQQIAGVLADLGGNPDIPLETHPQVQQAQAILDRTRLNLSYTVVGAPEDGTVTKVEQLQAGDYVTIGQPLFALISDQRVWVEANFKETDLTHMRPGQTATIDFDTYPDREFQAHVASLSPGTGSAFSLLPPENATGNWVKVIQRLPVRLQIESVPADVSLHSGMSATVEVDTHYRRKLFSMIESAFAAPEGRGDGR